MMVMVIVSVSVAPAARLWMAACVLSAAYVQLPAASRSTTTPAARAGSSEPGQTVNARVGIAGLLLAMLAVGCIQAQVCHTNECPVGVATQDPELRKRFPGQPEDVVNFLMFVAEEARELAGKAQADAFAGIDPGSPGAPGAPGQHLAALGGHEIPAPGLAVIQDRRQPERQDQERRRSGARRRVLPGEVVEYTIDSWHTMYYAAGYLFEQVNPRIAAYALALESLSTSYEERGIFP